MEVCVLWFMSKLAFEPFVQVIPNVHEDAQFCQFLVSSPDEVGPMAAGGLHLSQSALLPLQNPSTTSFKDSFPPCSLFFSLIVRFLV